MNTFWWFLGSSVLVLSLYLWILWVKWRAFPHPDYDSDETFPMINIVRQWMHVPTLKLRAGEMTVQEVRTVLAVLEAICAEMELKADPDLCEDEGCPHSDIPHGHNPAAAPEGYVHFQTDFYDVAKDSFPSITPAAAAEPVTSAAMPWHWIWEFLDGSAGFEGVFFGGRHPKHQGAYWWRHFLREALDEIRKSYRATPAAAAEPASMRMALQMLYDETADYIRLNNLGGMENQCMRMARAALATPAAESKK